MALTPPDPRVLKTRYPAFGYADDGLVQMLLQEALGAVDETWMPADQQPALLAYAAHLLAISRMGDQTLTLDDGTTLPVAGPLKSARVGPADFDFSDAALNTQAQQAAGANNLASTPYGRRYLELLRRNKPPVAVASAPVASPGMIPGCGPWGWGW